MEDTYLQPERNLATQDGTTIPHRGSSLNLILNSDASSKTDESNNAVEYPLVIRPGYFKDKEVFLTNPDILFNKEELNYRHINNDKSMNALKKRSIKKRIIQLATEFYYANSGHDSKQHHNISSSAVAEYFGIPKQSFHDHIRGIHLNSAVYGSSSKSLVNEVEMKIMENLLNMLKTEYNHVYPDKCFTISNKQLQDLYNIIHIRNQITQDELQLIDSRIQFLQESLFSGDEATRIQNQKSLISLQILSRLLTQVLFSNNLGRDYPIFKSLKIELLPYILEELLKVKSATSNVEESGLVKSLSKSTLNRLRKKLGMSCTKKRYTEEDLPVHGNEDQRPVLVSGEENDTGNNPKKSHESKEFDDITSILSTMQQQLNAFSKPTSGDTPLIRERFDSLLGQMAAIINDKHLGQDTITKINHYRKLRDQLLEFLKEVQGADSMGIALVDHISLTSDIILKLLFENVRLKKNAGSTTQLFHSIRRQRNPSTLMPMVPPTDSSEGPIDMNNALLNTPENNELRYNEHETNPNKRQRL
ncbi:hypothetical protein C6P44_001450 [Monosporozyma unispora]|nr:hypothetical protein C6P44_001450 [Kazachstania unispora]